MKTKILIAALIVCCLPFATQAADQDWAVGVSSDKTVYEVDLNTLRYGTLNDGARYIGAKGRNKDKASGNYVAFELYGVTAAHCDAEAGELVVMPVASELKTFSKPFMIGGGTIASEIAELLCAYHTGFKKQGRRSGS